MKFYPSYLFNYPLPTKYIRFGFAGCGYHWGHRLTMLNGTQDPSIQVNSGQVTVVFLLPGGTGETVLSGQSKISKNIIEHTRD